VRRLSGDLSGAIVSMLNKKPFILCKVSSRHFRITRASCLRISHDSLGMKKSNLRRVPRALDMNQKSERATLSHELLAIWQSDRSSGFQNMITGDESWFFLSYPRESVRVKSRDEGPDKIT
jgi:hypothetical protein